MSRLTFRSPAQEVAWQKQLRDRYLGEGVPPVPHLDLRRAEVRPVKRKLAEQIILKYEWLGTLPPQCACYFGIFFGIFCGGVTCISLGPGGANLNAHKEWGIERSELAYLTRGANVHWSPKGANSKLVSISCRLLARSTDAKLIIAYSDSDAGEIGTIYQACNWICVGRGASTRQWIAPNGRIYDQKYAANLAEREGVTRAAAVKALYIAGWREQKSNPKYRYVYVLDKLDKALVARVEQMRQPYPKRQPCDRGETDSAPRTNEETGGASPTRSLLNLHNPTLAGQDEQA